ncbi:MAG: hypothetical protein ACK5YA_01055 [bacterium]
MFKNSQSKPKSSRTNLNKKKDPHTAVISLTDFMRIQNTIVPSNQEKLDYNNRQDYDEKLKNISKARMREWPDSIEMSKKKKIEERKIAFFKLEEEKRRIDEEERKYQEIQNKLVVDRANRMFFEGQDAVKSFNSKLLVADAIKEIEYQKEIKQKKKEI